MGGKRTRDEEAEVFELVGWPASVGAGRLVMEVLARVRCGDDAAVLGEMDVGLEWIDVLDESFVLSDKVEFWEVSVSRRRSDGGKGGLDDKGWRGSGGGVKK